MNRNTILFVVPLLVAFLSPQPAAAHDLRCMVTPEEKTFRVEAWFDGDLPAESARVTVADSRGSIIHSGTTDERGVWSFPKPGPGSYRIVVESTGHREVAILRIPGEQPQSMPAAAPTVVTESRLSQTLGLSIGLALVLGGTGAFIVIRRLKRAA